MKLDQVAAITYTIRDFIKTEKGFRESCEKLAKIGFQAVELAGVPNDEISPATAVSICNEYGLRITSAHLGLEDTLDDPETVIEKAKQIGVRHIVYAYPHDTDFESTASIQKLIDRLNNAGKTYNAAGITLLYHNHALEFKRYDGRSILEQIFAETDPTALQAELDTYWVQRGGSDPVKWCQNMKGRLPTLHLKDMTVYEGNDSTMGEIGSGNLDFKSIIAAAEASGCSTFIIEQDVCPGDPFDSLKKSFDYAKANLVD
ncbi:sugar phosphate isomerase/epimerase family protein [Pelagicoccus mobilis]|uniref:Sugar phosphate isomerase/epimerase n=1 Tax=Pelagicoccus mobilis TaxID=415221 RepID=A0A934VUE0_9BACT|nr:sugar phosphate isomerase/epimerase [Pelagicoccus mobilis]MBK1880444.1 sugar phosphate isomerase/epimerase [Pelagicoccus mobilis]